jgi:hypothetical protein
MRFDSVETGAVATDFLAVFSEISISGLAGYVSLAEKFAASLYFPHGIEYLGCGITNNSFV